MIASELVCQVKDPFIYDNDSKAFKKLTLAIIMCTIFMLIEIAGGYISGSLAIITDAAHMLSDIAGFLISLFALSWSKKRSNESMSYGYHRAEILGAIISIGIVWMATIYLIVEAVQRLRHPTEVKGEIMLPVALFGVLTNVLLIFVLHTSHHSNDHSHQVENNLNVKAAVVHAVGDLLQSGGVLLASILIFYLPKYPIIDPICTLFSSVLVLMSTWYLLSEGFYILMEATPQSIKTPEILRGLQEVPGVVTIHDLHIWSLAPGKISATVHIVIDWEMQAEDGSFYHRTINRCQEVICSFGIHHATIQIDPSNGIGFHCRDSCF